MDKIICLEMLKSDLKTYQQLSNNPDYIIELKRINDIVKWLEIKDKITFYKYQIVLNQLGNYSYFEATFLDRINDNEYMTKIMSLCRNYDPDKDRGRKIF